MDTVILQFAGNLVVAGIGAWAGGKLGVRNALEKLRKERAFERRLAWYEETLSALVSVRDKCFLYAIATRQHNAEQLKILAPQMGSAFEAFGEKATKVFLYAPQRTVRRMDGLTKELFALAGKFVETLQRGELYEDFAKHLDALVLSLNQVIFDLAQEIRFELGIEPIELSDVQIRPRADF